MKSLVYEFQDPALLSLEEIGNILHVAEQLKAWAKDVEDYAFEQAKLGARISSWKLVEGRSNRKITDENEVGRRLGSAGVTEFLRMSLRPLGELEKLVGKKELTGLIGDLIVKPPGRPTLVPETDKRPEINSLEADFAQEDFSE
jgi:hypothetical protein